MKILNKVLNILFQSLWYSIRGLIPRKIGKGETLNDFAPRIIAQVLLSYLFGGPKIVLLGDSNSARFSSFRVMTRFDVVAISIGVPGSRMDQWSAFFATKIGRIVLSLIASAATFVNCGGNNVLHRSVDLVEPSAKTVKSLLPHSWIILIPPLHLEFFSIWMLPETLQKDINKVNANLKQVWNPRVINPTDLVDKDADGHPDFGSLKDPIHYSTKIVFQIQSRIEGLLVDR